VARARDMAMDLARRRDDMDMESLQGM